MLILTRRIGEVLRIGEDVSVTVLGLKGKQVRLGVAAPKSIAVHREEIFRRISEESRAASEESPVASEESPVAALPEVVETLRKVVRIESKRAGRRRSMISGA